MNEIPELVERFRAGGELVRQALEGVSGPEADFRPGPDAWGVRQLAAHLADSEVVAGWRFRRLIADRNPTLEAFDEKLWAANLAYDRRDHTGNLASFLRLREENSQILALLPPEAFERAGTHVERGRVTLRDMVMINVIHAEHHAEQIRRVRDSFRINTSSKK